MDQFYFKYCCLCSQILDSNTELTNHIRTRHTKEFNCTECDFQATSVIILNKHINHKHKKNDDPDKNKLKCTHCNEQFSALWNIIKHKREKHDIVEECSYFQKGRCKFANQCWNKHTALEQNSPTQTTIKSYKCYDCRKAFT